MIQNIGTHLNKNWEENLLNLKPTHYNGLFTAATCRAHDYHFPENGGLHCIAAGMNWSPTDLTTVMHINNMQNIKEYKESWMPYIKQIDERKKMWNEIVKDKLSLFEFLKENIYNENIINK